MKRLTKESKVCSWDCTKWKKEQKAGLLTVLMSLKIKSTRNSVNRIMDALQKMKGQRDCLYVDEVKYSLAVLHPAPEKQYRPFETIEEAQVMKGKWIRSKILHRVLYGNKYQSGCFYQGVVDKLDTTEVPVCNEFVIDETGEPVGVEVWQ